MPRGQALTLENGRHERHRLVKPQSTHQHGRQGVLVQFSKFFQRLIAPPSNPLSSRVQQANFNACLQELKPKLTISILWKDAQTCGLKGVVELSEFDLPFKTARVGDLFSLLDVKINSKYRGDRKFREVQSIQLYGSHLPPDRLLDPLIPELGLVPRFVAIMRVYKKMPRTNISVFVKTLTNDNILIHCSSYDTVGSLKGKIQDKLNIARAVQCMVFANIKLADHLSLFHYGITNRSQIYLVRMMNGGGASRIFVDLSGNSPRVEDFARKAPAYRRACRGLNIEGKCENPQCTAFRKWIICPKGLLQFNVIRDEDIKCPMCHSKVIPLSCGFYDCTWKFDGIQSNGENPVISQWKDARGYKYHRFCPDKSVEWDSLLIIAKQLDMPAEPCSICWSSLGSSDSVAITTACGHTFHCQCINEWSGWCIRYGNSASCPICREEVKRGH
ncbi:hypothetical protein DVH05_005069 [Phytophthora capsici]|nr:hypothetical protein DVH05_005069 [Phytophthora capsici]